MLSASGTDRAVGLTAAGHGRLAGREAGTTQRALLAAKAKSEGRRGGKEQGDRH